MKIPVGTRGGQQGTKMKNPGPVVTTESREILTTKELHTHQSQPRVLTASKPVSSQIRKGNKHQVKTTIPANIPIPQEPKPLNLKELLLHELKVMLENREPNQAQYECPGLPQAADHLTKEGLTDSCPGCLQWGNESFPGAACPSRGHRHYYGTTAGALGP